MLQTLCTFCQKKPQAPTLFCLMKMWHVLHNPLQIQNLTLFKVCFWFVRKCICVTYVYRHDIHCDMYSKIHCRHKISLIGSVFWFVRKLIYVTVFRRACMDINYQSVKLFLRMYKLGCMLQNIVIIFIL